MGLWDKVGQLMGRGGSKPPPNEPPEVGWLADDQNRWGVPVLDVRPVTQTMLCCTSDKSVAEKFNTMTNDDGTAFAQEDPPVARVVEASLRYRAEGPLPPGVLFYPKVMEHKWAIYHHAGRLIFARTWQRRAFVVADVRVDSGQAVVGPIRGAFDGTGDEPASFTMRLLDWFVRSHALDMVWPAPLPAGAEAQPRTAALWCISALGNLAVVATPHEVPGGIPERPLRVHSLLHIAVARGDRVAVKSLVESGLTFDLRAKDGLTPVHWALKADMLAFCLDAGAPVDVRSDEGATPLMQAAQARSREQMALLLSRGADPDAKDARGFTALHRAAEMGEIELVRLLLEHGASRSLEAQGHTPGSLAEKRGHPEIAKLLA
ncbi:ankyrin repeat domain-containing protein [bacterium]|nr:ankyrin repeat domain-containing protein [bacterium]